MMIGKTFRRIVDFILDLEYPPKCMFCREIVPSSNFLCCNHCLYDLPEVDVNQKSIPGFERIAAPFYYEQPVRSALLRFKFYRYVVYADQLSHWIASSADASFSGKFDVVSWVPCSPLRRMRRGYDQAELLAKGIAKELGLPVLRTLRKKRHNKPQSRTRSAAQRRANVIGAYRPYHPERWAGKRILLVDDIITTGSTMSECGKTLLLAGADTLYGAAAAMTRRESKK